MKLSSLIPDELLNNAFGWAIPTYSQIYTFLTPHSTLYSIIFAGEKPFYIN
jgi:hypothetical protein